MLEGIRAEANPRIGMVTWLLGRLLHRWDRGTPLSQPSEEGSCPESLQPSEVLGFTSAAMDLLIKINVFLPYLILHVKLTNASF